MQTLKDNNKHIRQLTGHNEQRNHTSQTNEMEGSSDTYSNAKENGIPPQPFKDSTLTNLQ
jgi:hypothetical protein